MHGGSPKKGMVFGAEGFGAFMGFRGLGVCTGALDRVQAQAVKGLGAKFFASFGLHGSGFGVTSSGFLIDQ